MNSILSLIKRLSPNKYIGKPEKKELENLSKNLDKRKHEKLLEVLNEVIKATKYTKKLKETLENLINDLEVEGITEEKVKNLIEEAIEEIKEIEDENLEKILDESCDRYNKFTESNPAEYVSCGKDKSYRLILPNEKEIKSKNLSKIIERLKEKKSTLFGKKLSKFCTLKKIEYNGKKIIIYLSENNKAYFDINHIINLLDDINIRRKKYDEYKNDIELYDIRDNEYGGFYVKEFINQETFYKMLLHSNSSFSRKFKDEISKILDKLTSQGSMVLSNDKLVLVEKKPIEYLTDEYNYVQRYDNENLVNFIKEQIKNFKKSNWNKYLNRHIMYFFIITLEDPNGLNRILCKIGYSCDLLKRIKSLEGEYKCKFYLIGLKLVHSVQDEKEFHNLLKKKYSEFVVDLKISNTDKDECYVFDISLYETYLNYIDKGEFNLKEIKIEEETKNILEEYFRNIEERYEKELLLKIRPNIEISKIKSIEQKEYAIELNTKYYDYMLSSQKEGNRHKEAMKDKDIILREKDIEYKKIELEILDRKSVV